MPATSRFIATVVLLLFVVLCITQNVSQVQKGDDATPIPSLDVNAVDPTIDPCVDFYQYACGGWMKQNPLPPDQSAWFRYDQLNERNQLLLRQILESARGETPSRDSIQQKLGNFFDSCMDESAISRKGLETIASDLNRISALSSRAKLPETVAALHQHGVSAFFHFGRVQDYKNARQVIAEIDVDGLGLPDRSYYVNQDDGSIELRNRYVHHMEKLFELSGETAEQARVDVASVLALESALAKSSLSHVQRRDEARLYHRMSTQQLYSLNPAFSWRQYLLAIGGISIHTVNVSEIGYFAGFDQIIKNSNLSDLRAYLRWQTLHAAAPFLSSSFADEDFEFYGKILRGAKSQAPRWKRCVRYTDTYLGFALGRLFVMETFRGGTKQRVLTMVRQIEASLQDDINSLTWMDNRTREKALMKLEAIANNIGYPDKWRDYGSLHIVRGDLTGNVLRANEFEFRRQLKQIGKPVDRNDWDGTPTAVDAYYSRHRNDITVPAGALQPPLYDPDADDAVNLGAIGMWIAHELVHAFDDQGSKYDSEGNLADWWAPEAATAFGKRAACFVNEYNSFEPVPGIHLNGTLTLSENMADNGGLRVSSMTMEKTIRRGLDSQKDGFTLEQRFFLAFAQGWCENASPEAVRLLARTNSHSRGRFRVNGAVRNIPDFRKAFSCKTGQPMAPATECRAW